VSASGPVVLPGRVPAPITGLSQPRSILLTVALNIPPGFASVSLPLQHELLGRTAFITYGIDISDWAGDNVSAANAQVTSFIVGFGTDLDSQVTVGPAILQVGQDPPPPLTVVGTTTDSGSETGAMPPPSVSLLVKKSTNLGGRQGRGRCFIPWVVQEAGVNDIGNLDGGTLSARQADATAWFEDLEDNGVTAENTPVYLLHDEPLVGPAPAPTIVVGLTVDQLVANQRRRLGR
jgi:hypothetical protein